MSKLKSLAQIHKTRPQKINEAIDQVYESIAKDPKSQWSGTNGDHDYYHLARIDEHALIKHIIDSTPKQSDYFFMELGAGVFKWGKCLTEFLNTNYLETNKNFHIIGVSGEGAEIQYGSDKVIYTPKVKKMDISNCQLYEINGFKLETIHSELTDLGFNLLNKVDFIISNFTFRHLVDPVGTFTQAYELLKPEAGFILTEGFSFARLSEESSKPLYDLHSLIYDNLNMMHFLADLGAKFLVGHYRIMRSFDHYLIKKPLSNLTESCISYFDLTYKAFTQNASGYTTQLLDQGNKKVVFKKGFEKDNHYRGDKELFDFCRKTQIFQEEDDISLFKGSITFDSSFELANYLKEVFPKASLSTLSSIIVEYLIGEKLGEQLINKRYFAEKGVIEVITNMSLKKLQTGSVRLAAENGMYKATDIIMDYLDIDSGIPQSLQEALMVGEDNYLL